MADQGGKNHPVSDGSQRNTWHDSPDGSDIDVNLEQSDESQHDRDCPGIGNCTEHCLQGVAGTHSTATPRIEFLQSHAHSHSSYNQTSDDEENGLIHLYSKKFSTYSVGYFDGSERPSSHSTPSGSSVWIQEPVPAADEKITSTDVTAVYAGIVFIPATTVELRQIEAVNPAYAELISASLEAAENDGISLTNSKGAKVIIIAPDEIPGIQKETFAQIIDVASADGSKVTSVPFMVRLSDLAAKNLTTDDVTLYHYLEEYGLWIPLETGLVSTDDVYAYYEAATDGASPFGVLLKKLDAPEVQPVPTQTGATPAPFMGVLAGLGAAAVVFGLRRK